MLGQPSTGGLDAVTSEGASLTELQAMYVAMSEELERANRDHAESMATIQSVYAMREEEVAEMTRLLDEARTHSAQLEARVIELEVRVSSRFVLLQIS